LQTPVSGEGGGGGAPGIGAEIPLQLVEKTMVRRAVPLQPMEVHGGAGTYLQPMEDPTLEQVDEPKRCCDPVERPCYSRLSAGPVEPWRGAHTGAGLLAGLVTPWEGPMLEKFMEDSVLWEGPHVGAGEECEEEGVAETMCDELITTPIPHAPVPLRVRR